MCSYWITTFGFASLGFALTGILSSTIGLNIRPIISGIRKYELIIKKCKKTHDEIILSVKTKSDCKKGSSFRSLIKSYISLYDFDSMNDVLRNIW